MAALRAQFTPYGVHYLLASWRGLASVAVLSAVVLWAYWPLLGRPRAEWNEICGDWDDRANFLENDLVRRPLSLATARQMLRETRVNVYEPCGWLLKALVQGVFASNRTDGLLDIAARGHRLTSLALHWLCSLSLFVAICSILAATGQFEAAVGEAAALGAASVWAAHPIHAEVVGWLSAQPYPLATLFVLQMVHAHLRVLAAERRRLSCWNIAGPMWYALAVLSKSVAVASPASIFALDLVLSSPSSVIIARHFYGYACVTAVAVPLTVVANRLGDDPSADVVRLDSLAQRLSKAIVTVWFCLGNVLKPARLRPHYALDSYFWTGDDWSEPIVALGISGATTLAAVGNWLDRRPQLFALWIHWCASFLPSCGLVQHGMIQKGGDRYAYIPTLGIAVSLAGVLASRRFRLLPAVACLVSMEAALTRTQLPIWRTDDTLLTYSLKIDPTDWRVLDTYAEILLRRGQQQDARPMLQAALNSVLDLHLPPNPKELVFRGKLLVLLGEADQGCLLFDQAKSDYPESAMAHNNAAVCGLRKHDLRHLQEPVFRKALDLAYRDEHRVAISRNLHAFLEWQLRSFEGRIDATLVY